MQKKSFLIKDILQKLNEDDSLKRNHLIQQNSLKLINLNNDLKSDDLEKNLKKIPSIDSNQLLYDWHSFAISTMTQNNDCESNVDVQSEASSLISIENTEDETNSVIKNNQVKSAEELKKEEKKKRKNRRNRTVFTELQLMGLERRFDKLKYLSTPDRAELANALGLSQLQVKTWYQNRRMKWKKQVMQSGCLVAPTKPKGRPKKGTIPSLGLTFDTSTLLSAVEARKNSRLGNNKEQVINKISNTAVGYDVLNLGNTPSSNELVLVNQIKNMNSLIISKDLPFTATNNQLINTSIQNDVNQQFFSKISLANKKSKLIQLV